MFAGQVNWSNPANAAGQQALPPNFAAGEESETAFALVYEAVLGLADDQCSRSGASNNWLDTDGEGDLPETQDSSRLNGAMSVGSGVGAYGSTGQNSNSEIAFAFPGAANYGSSMERFMSRSSQAQLEPVPTQAAGIDPAWATNRARLDGSCAAVRAFRRRCCTLEFRRKLEQESAF